VPTPAETELDIDIGQGTPWRILVVSDTAAALIDQAGIIPTLATPCVLEDTSWIKAGRAYAYGVPIRRRTASPPRTGRQNTSLSNRIRRALVRRRH